MLPPQKYRKELVFLAYTAFITETVTSWNCLIFRTMQLNYVQMNDIRPISSPYLWPIYQNKSEKRTVAVPLLLFHWSSQKDFNKAKSSLNAFKYNKYSRKLQNNGICYSFLGRPCQAFLPLLPVRRQNEGALGHVRPAAVDHAVCRGYQVGSAWRWGQDWCRCEATDMR